MFYEKLDNFRRVGESDTDYAQRLGVSRQVFHLWKRGIHRPNRKTTEAILSKLGMNEEEFWTKNNTPD